MGKKRTWTFTCLSYAHDTQVIVEWKSLPSQGTCVAWTWLCSCV